MRRQMHRPSAGFAVPSLLATLLMTTTHAFAQTVASPVRGVTPNVAAGTKTGSRVSSTDQDAAGAGSVEQVVVRSLKRATNLQKTPAAVTALTSATLDKENITSVAGLNGLIPGTTFTKSSGFENIVTIRGIGSQTPENALTTVPGVSLMEDGVYIANTIALNQAFFDLDQLEVLRGPQGSVYGQSSTGGVISLVSKQPVLGIYSGHADFSAGNYNLFQERAAVNIPIAPTVAVRLSFQKADHDGFGESTAIPGDPGYQLDEQHDISGKAAVLWKPTDDFSATLTAQVYSANQNGAEQKNVLDPNPDKREVTQDYPSKFKLRTELYHLNLAWDLPFGTLKSVSGYQNLAHSQQEDGTRLSTAVIGFYDDVAAWNTDMQSYTEELDLESKPGSRLDWIVGVFAMKQRSNQYVAEFGGTDSNPDLTIGPDIQTNPPANLTYGNITTVNRISYSPYAQVTFHVNDRLRLTAGGRYNHDNYNEFNKNFAASGISSSSTQYSVGRPTGKLGIEYDLAAHHMLYASLTEAYKPGGVNGNPNSQVVGNTFAPEGVTAFEIGSKNTFLNNHLRLNVSAFYYDYRNMQYLETDPFPYAYGISNIPDVHIWGAETEASYLTLGDRLRFNGQLTLENGKIMGNYKAIDTVSANHTYATNPACAFGGQYYNPGCWAAVEAGAQNVSGNRPPQMPAIQAAVSVEYTADVWRGKLTSRAEFVYRGFLYSRVFHDGYLDDTPGYGIVNIGFQYKPDASRWNTSLNFTNIGDRNGVNSRYTDPYGTGQTSEQYIAPFQVVGQVGFTF